MCLSVSHLGYSLTPLPIFMKFEISVVGGEAEQHIFKDFLKFPSRFEMVLVLWVYFAVTDVEQGLLSTELLV